MYVAFISELFFQAERYTSKQNKVYFLIDAVIVEHEIAYYIYIYIVRFQKLR